MVHVLTSYVILIVLPIWLRVQFLIEVIDDHLMEVKSEKSNLFIRMKDDQRSNMKN